MRYVRVSLTFEIQTDKEYTLSAIGRDGYARGYALGLLTSSSLSIPLSRVHGVRMLDGKVERVSVTRNDAI